MSAVPEVPAAYLGVWKRTLLRAPGIEDTTSRVYWLQTKNWHADIRVPAERPALAGTRDLQSLSRDELLGLARQQGFAGITVIEGDICRWQRLYDYQPPSGANDIGRMVFETPACLHEYGVEADYFEIWERLPGSSGPCRAIHSSAAPAMLWLEAGDYCMRVRPRARPLAQSASLAAVAEDMDEAGLCELLDFEISFGQKKPGGVWQVLLSTLPWLEGSMLF